METKVKEWGNRLGLRIPKPLALEVGLDNDSLVELSLLDGKLISDPISEEPLSLDELLTQVTKSNLPDKVNTGAVVRGEAWEIRIMFQ